MKVENRLSPPKLLISGSATLQLTLECQPSGLKTCSLASNLVCPLCCWTGVALGEASGSTGDAGGSRFWPYRNRRLTFLSLRGFLFSSSKLRALQLVWLLGWKVCRLLTQESTTATRLWDAESTVPHKNQY